MNPNNEKIYEESCFTNSVVVSLMLKVHSLDLKALKVFRFVHSTWNNCATKFIKQRNDLYSTEPKFESNYDFNRFIFTFENRILLHNSFNFNISHFSFSCHNELFMKFCNRFGSSVKGLNLSKCEILKKHSWSVKFPNINKLSDDSFNISNPSVSNIEVIRIGPKNFRKLLMEYFPNIENLTIRETIYKPAEFQSIFIEDDQLPLLKNFHICTSTFEPACKKISGEILKISKNLTDYKITFEAEGAPGVIPTPNAFLPLKMFIDLNPNTTKVEFNLQIDTEKVENGSENSEINFLPIEEYKSLRLNKLILSEWKKENSRHLSVFFTSAKPLADALYNLQIDYAMLNNVTVIDKILPSDFPFVRSLALSFNPFDQRIFPILHFEEIQTKFYLLEELYIKQIKISEPFIINSGWIRLWKICLFNVELNFSVAGLLRFFKSFESSISNLSHFNLHLSEKNALVPNNTIISDLYFLWAAKKHEWTRTYIFQFDRNGLDACHYYLNGKELMVTPIFSNRFFDDPAFVPHFVKSLNLTKYPIYVLNEQTLDFIKEEFPLLESLAIRFTSFNMRSLNETSQRLRKTRICFKNVLSLYRYLTHLSLGFDTPIEELEPMLENAIQYFNNLESLSFRWYFDAGFTMKYPHLFERSEAADSFFLHDTIVNRGFKGMYKLKKLQMSMKMCNELYESNLKNNFSDYDNIFSKITADCLRELTLEDSTDNFLYNGFYRSMRDLSKIHYFKID